LHFAQVTVFPLGGMSVGAKRYTAPQTAQATSIMWRRF